MKAKKYLLSGTLIATVTLLFTACLKDSRNIDFTKVGRIVEFDLGGTAFFSKDAITDTTAADGSIVRKFSLTVASPTPPTTATKISLAADFSLVASYNAANPAVKYVDMPTDAYKFTSTDVTIPAGQTTAIVPVTFYKNKLDPTVSYMLPIKIAGAPYTISSNMGVHYYHFIGNVFAGSYTYDYTRTPPSGNVVGGTSTLYPVTPTQFEGFSGYYTGTVRYEVTFTVTGFGSSATYSNFQVSLNSDDVKNILTANKISVTDQPVIVTPGYDPAKQYTYTEALKLFDFKYAVLGGSGSRTVEDRWYK